MPGLFYVLNQKLERMELYQTINLGVLNNKYIRTKWDWTALPTKHRAPWTMRPRIKRNKRNVTVSSYQRDNWRQFSLHRRD